MRKTKKHLKGLNLRCLANLDKINRGAGGGVRYAHRPLASVLQIKSKHHAMHGRFCFSSSF